VEGRRFVSRERTPKRFGEGLPQYLLGKSSSRCREKGKPIRQREGETKNRQNTGIQREEASFSALLGNGGDCPIQTTVTGKGASPEKEKKIGERLISPTEEEPN